MADLYTIKPLEWIDNSGAYDKSGAYDVHEAHTPFGKYAAFKRTDGTLAFCWCRPGNDASDIPFSYQCDSIEDAKEKAWENWLKRLGGALEPGGPDDAS